MRKVVSGETVGKNGFDWVFVSERFDNTEAICEELIEFAYTDKTKIKQGLIKALVG